MNAQTLLVAALAGLVGGGGGALLVTYLAPEQAPVVAPVVSSGDAPAASGAPAADVPGDQEGLAELRVRLAVQASRLQTLEGQLRQFEAGDPALAGVDGSAGTSAEESDEADQSAPRRGRLTHSRQLARLAEAGVPEGDGQAIIARVEEVQWQRTELRYRAMHEGWVRSERYQEEMAKLPSARDTVTEEFGDQAWDSYLYASGQPNRVAVRHVLNNSPASSAGLQAGDLISTYDGEAVSRVRDIISIAARGEPGETVEMEVLRDGRLISTYVPRGPVGFSGEAVSVNPEAPRS